MPPSVPHSASGIMSGLKFRTHDASCFATTVTVPGSAAGRAPSPQETASRQAAPATNQRLVEPKLMPEPVALTQVTAGQRRHFSATAGFPQATSLLGIARPRTREH